MTSWCLNNSTMSTNSDHLNKRPLDNELLPEEETLNKIESSAMIRDNEKSMPRNRRRRVSYDSDLPKLQHPPNGKQRKYQRRNSKVASMLAISTNGQSLEHSWNDDWSPSTLMGRRISAEGEQQGGMLWESTATEMEFDNAGKSREAEEDMPSSKKRKR